MNAAAVVLSSSDDADALPDSYSVPSAADVSGQPLSSQSVGAVLRDSLTPDQREAAIRKAGDLIVRYMALAEADGGKDYFTYRGLADRARLSMEALIKGRAADWKRQA